MTVKIGAQPGGPDVPLTLSHTFHWSYNKESGRKPEMEKKHPQVYVTMNTQLAVDTCSPVNLPARQHWHSSFWKPSHPIKSDTGNICRKSTYPVTDLAYIAYLMDMYSSIFCKRGREISINPSYLIAAVQLLWDMLIGQL